MRGRGGGTGGALDTYVIIMGDSKTIRDGNTMEPQRDDRTQRKWKSIIQI